MVTSVLMKIWMRILWINVKIHMWWNFVLYLLLLITILISKVALLNPNSSFVCFLFEFMACILSFCMCSFCNKLDKMETWNVFCLKASQTIENCECDIIWSQGCTHFKSTAPLTSLWKIWRCPLQAWNIEDLNVWSSVHETEDDKFCWICL